MYKKIKAFREYKGMSLQKLSEDTGIAKSTLQRYETGITKKIPADAIAKIEDALGVKITSDKLTEEDERDISEMLESCLRRLDGDSALMFNGDVLDNETRDLLKVSLENSIRIAKMVSGKKD